MSSERHYPLLSAACGRSRHIHPILGPTLWCTLTVGDLMRLWIPTVHDPPRSSPATSATSAMSVARNSTISLLSVHETLKIVIGTGSSRFLCEYHRERRTHDGRCVIPFLTNCNYLAPTVRKSYVGENPSLVRHSFRCPRLAPYFCT